MLNKLVMVAALLLLGSSMAQAATAVSTASVNLRAGPSTSYPAVAVVPAGSNVITHGCVSDYTWCDISYANHRGWVAANYLQVIYKGAPVVLTPAVAPAANVTVVVYDRAYWDTYYAAYPWYGTWANYPPYRVGVTGTTTAVTSNGGTASKTTGCVAGRCGTTGKTAGAYGGTAAGARGCGANGCGAAGTVTGSGGNTASGARACGRNGCGAVVVGPQGNTATRRVSR